MRDTESNELIILPPEFRTTMDRILHLDDILVVTKGTKDQHMKKVEWVLQTQSEAANLLKKTKTKMMQMKTERSGFKLSASEKMKQVDDKTQANSDKLRPKN